MSRLTKEECLDALSRLEMEIMHASSLSYKYKERVLSVSNVLFQLINEHFDNPKISLEIETGDWIPCKERMPKNSRNVVITTSSNVVGVGSYLGNGWVQWYSGGGMAVDVLAWRELPKPYGGD